MFHITVAGLLVALSYVAGECNEGCKEPTLLYDDLKCKPIFSDENNCCPVEYDCSHIEERALNQKNECYFHGKYYQLHEEIDSNEIYGNCKVGCRCGNRYSGELGFVCAVLDCPEWLGRRPQLGCHFKYKLDKCCNVGEACPPFNVSCLVGNTTYYEGQKFNPVGVKCTRCVCQAGFEGKYEEPFCRKMRCIEEVNHGRNIERFCAPSYIDISDCCPFHWICPEPNDVIISATKLSTHTSATCKFGDKVMNIGDKFTRTTEKGGHLSCECRIPPYLTCIQNYEYPTYAPY